MSHEPNASDLQAFRVPEPQRWLVYCQNENHRNVWFLSFRWFLRKRLLFFLRGINRFLETRIEYAKSTMFHFGESLENRVWRIESRFSIIIIIMFNTSIALFTFTYDQKRFTNFKNPL